VAAMTALNYVTITESWGDGTGSGSAVSGTVTFTPTATVYASGTPLVVPEIPVQALITAGQMQSLDGGSVQLLATDNTLTVEGPNAEWLWSVTIEVTEGGNTVTDSWEFALPHSPGTVDLYATRNPA
jgi:hypothetical protein